MYHAISKRAAMLLVAALGQLPLAIGAGAQVLPGQGPAESRSAEDLVRLRVLTDTDPVGPGQTFHLAFLFQIEPHWHIYWRNPGDSGASTEIDVTAPEGFEVGPIRWARPRSFKDFDGVTFGYDEQVVLFVPITAPATLEDSVVQFRAEVSWLVCRSVCLMGRGTRVIDVHTVASPERARKREDPLLARHRHRLPDKLEDVEAATMEFDGRTLRVAGPALGHRVVRFFPDERPGVRYGDAKGVIQDDRYHLEVAVMVKEANARGKPMAVAGLVALGEARDDPCYELEWPLPGSQR